MRAGGRGREGKGGVEGGEETDWRLERRVEEAGQGAKGWRGGDGREGNGGWE